MISYEHFTQKYIRLGCFCGFWWGLSSCLQSRTSTEWSTCLSSEKEIAEAEDLFAKLCFRFCLSFKPLSTSLSPTQAEFEDLNFIPRGTLSRLKPHCEACAAFHISRYVFTIPSPLSTYTNCHEVLDHLPHYKILGSIQILIECWSEAQASNEWYTVFPLLTRVMQTIWSTKSTNQN